MRRTIDEPWVRGSEREQYSRREFLQTAATMASAATVPGALAQAKNGMTAAGAAGGSDRAQLAQTITLNVNGRLHELTVEPRLTLLDALREHLELTGTKKGCDRGQCGACTVIAGGRRINSCLALAVMHEHEPIVTVEGLAAADGTLHALQTAFIKHDAFQCGYCTPGQLCSAVALIEEVRSDPSRTPLSDDDIRERMSGNICRCGAYPNIVAAVREVLDQAGGAPHG